MEFVVPKGDSRICHIEVNPELPVNGVAQPWRMINTSVSPAVEVKSLDVWFSIASEAWQRKTERMIFVFSIAESVQKKEDQSWRFSQEGIVYSLFHSDYLGDISTELSDDGLALTLCIKSLTDIEEKFDFRFLGLHMGNASGRCELFASADPNGGAGRR